MADLGTSDGRPVPMFRHVARLFGSSRCSDADLQLASNVLQLCNSILTKFPGTTEKICGTLLAPALQLVQSPLLQGSTLTVRAHTHARDDKCLHVQSRTRCFNVMIGVLK